MNQKVKHTCETWKEFQERIISDFSSHSLHQSLRHHCCFVVVFWGERSLSNVSMLDFAVSLSKVMVMGSDIIHYLVRSNAVDELEHKEKVYSMSKKLLIYINLQTDNNFEHQSTKVL